MSQKEGTPLSEVASRDVYSKAREILDLYGHPGTKPTFPVDPRHVERRPRIIRDADIPITEAPIVPVQIAGNDYRLWLTSEDDRQPDGVIALGVHFQQLPYGLDRIEYDSDGYVARYWYRPSDEAEPRRVEVVRSYLVPKELEFGWYMAKLYKIQRNGNSSKVLKYVRPEIVEGLGDGNDFLLGILEEMQKKLATVE